MTHTKDDDALPLYEDLDDTGVIGPLRVKADGGDPVAVAVHSLVGKMNRLGATVNGLVAAELEDRRREARFDGALKVVLGILSLVGTAALGGVLWLVAVAWTADRDIPALHDDVAELRAADAHTREELDATRETLSEIRELHSETSATMRAIDARLGRIERHLDEHHDGN